MQLLSMEPEQQSKLNPPKKGFFVTSKIVFLFLLIEIASIITVFAGGFYAQKLLTGSPIPDVVESPTPTMEPRVTPGVDDETPFIPGKQYIDDTLIMITEESPHITLVASVSRYEQQSGFIQNTRVSYFDGKNWIRELNSLTKNNGSIAKNSLLKEWNIEYDKSMVLRQTVKGKIEIQKTPIEFDTGVLENEIGIRSLPGYTKFMSEGNGTLKVNDRTYSSKVLYDRIYSSDSNDVFFYGSETGITTDWLAAWDTEGNFYHIDSTFVKAELPNYKSHSLGIRKDNKKGVTKIFDLNIKRDDKNPPLDYTITLSDPIGSVLTFTKINGLNKSPNNSNTWNMGQIEGTVRDGSGRESQIFGLEEFILK